MPKQSNEKEVGKTKFFTLKEIDIEFDNGDKAVYSIAEKNDSTMIVPILDDNKLVLIEEYFAAIDKTGLCLPKGQVDDNNPLESANLELQEEAGYKASKLVKLSEVLVSPGNMRHKTHIYLATGLTESKLKGDEKHKIKVKIIPFNEFEKYIDNGEFFEARAIAALYLARKFFKEKIK